MLVDQRGRRVAHEAAGSALRNPSEAALGFAPAGMTPAQARTATRAAVRTTRIRGNSKVRSYLDPEPRPRLFGQPLRDVTVEDADCPKP